MAELAFVVIPIVLAFTFSGGVAHAWRMTDKPKYARRAGLVALVATTVWMLFTWELAARGILRQWDMNPPPFMLLVVSILAIAFFIGFGATGRRLAAGTPLAALVAVQAFRLPLEIAMHQLSLRGIMPAQMSYSGRNFDIVTGASAIVVAALVFWGRGGRRLVAVWNVLGLALLVNVVTVAILSTPRFKYFGDSVNVFVTYVPFVWLPAVMVLAALAGHLVIFRALSEHRRYY